MSDRVAVIVLAGGRSSRFGAPKLEADLDGRPLLEHVIAVAREVGTEIVVAVPPTSGPALPADVRLIRDPEPFGGPLVGLAAGLAAVVAPTAIVIGGDMPRLRAEVLRAMLAVLDRPMAPDAVTLGNAGRSRPLPVAIRVGPARAAAAAALAAGDRSLRSLVDRLGGGILEEQDWRPLDPEGDTLVDVDVPEDLVPLQRSGGTSEARERRLP